MIYEMCHIISILCHYEFETFAFVADRNVFVDAFLVSGAENGYNAEFRKSTTICCGFYFGKTTTYGGVFEP